MEGCLRLQGKFFLISNDAGWRDALGVSLQDYGAKIFHVDTIEDANELETKYHADIVLVDLTRERSFKNFNYFRSSSFFKNAACIVFVRKDQLFYINEMIGFDDFVLKGNNVEETVVRISRVLLLKEGGDRKDNIIRVRDLVIDLENYEVFINGKSVCLTFREFELLKFLLKNRGRVFSRDHLLDKVWGYDNYTGTRTVDIHIQRLRYKLGSPVGDMIITVRNVGYKFSM